MIFEVDQSEAALDATGIAWELRAFGERAQGTVGQVAGLVLCTCIDEESDRPVNTQMATQFDVLCSFIAERLRYEPAHALSRSDQGAKLWNFRGDATLMMRVALGHFDPWHGAILRLWSQRPSEVFGWLEAKHALYAGSPTWMDDCRKEIEAGHRVAIQQAAAMAKPQSSISDELQVFRTLVVRMFLAGLPKAERQENPVWTQLGLTKADRPDIDKIFQMRAVEFLGDDATKRYVAMAMVEVLGEDFVRERYPYVHARYMAELAQRDRQ